VRKSMVCAIAVLLVAACSGQSAPRRAAEAARRRAPRVALAPVTPAPVAIARRLTGSWSRTVSGSPGGIAADRDGTVAMVDDDTVVALDRDGSERWSTPVPGAGLGWPSLGHGLVVAPTQRDEGGPGGCVALDRTTGARRWSYEEKNSQGVAVARAGGEVICALANGVVVAIDRETGARRWRHVIRSADHYSVAIPERSALAIDEATGTLAIGTTFDSYSVVDLLDLATGSDRNSLASTHLGALSSPVSAARGVLAVGVSPGTLCTFDIARRRRRCVIVSTTSEGFDPASIPLVVGGDLVIATDSSVVAVDLASMKVRWTAPVANPVLDARPAVADGVVMLCDWTRVAWAFRLADGAPVEIPKTDGWAIATVADPGGGFDVAEKDLDGGWIEHWAPAR
jgi:outer membrane protein assembly factor BamB